MKIRGSYSSSVSGVGKIRGGSRSGDVSGVKGTSATGIVDRVHLSGQSSEVQRARVLAIHAPDIREDLVDELMREIAQGRYRVVGAQVVDKMIREHLQMITH